MLDFKMAVHMAKTIAVPLCGRSFVLVMAHKADNTSRSENYQDFHLVPRDQLPCWGELRKYKVTHGINATKDEDRPHDLHQPFPEGMPVALSIRLDQLFKDKELIEELWYEGPWNVSNDIVDVADNTITFSAVDPKKGLQLDSTVLVSFLAFATRFQPDWYKKTRAFLSSREAIFSYMTLRGDPKAFGIPLENSYYFANTSADRVINKKPQPLSGGAFGDGFDYDRKGLQDVFSADKPELAFRIQEFFLTEGLMKMDPKTYKWSGALECEDYCREFKRGLYLALEKETL